LTGGYNCFFFNHSFVMLAKLFFKKKQNADKLDDAMPRLAYATFT
jgi:hypothetical protein